MHSVTIEWMMLSNSKLISVVGVNHDMMSPLSTDK